MKIGNKAHDFAKCSILMNYVKTPEMWGNRIIIALALELKEYKSKRKF